MFDKLIETCNELKDAYTAKKDAEQALKDATHKVESLQSKIKAFTQGNTLPTSLKESLPSEFLYPYGGEIYLVSFSENHRALIAEKIEFYKPQD